MSTRELAVAVLPTERRNALAQDILDALIASLGD
jgi:hypothetical protein